MEGLISKNIGKQASLAQIQASKAPVYLTTFNFLSFNQMIPVDEIREEN